MSDIGATFLNLFRLNLLPKLGLDASKVKYGPDYTYIEIPWSGEMFSLKDETILTEAKNGQRVRLIPSVNLGDTIYKEKVLVVINPRLHEVAEAPAMQLLETSQGERISVIARFFRDATLSELDWLVRLYVLR